MTTPPLRLARGLVLMLFIGLAVIHTWPLATSPGRLSRNDQMDTQLNEWTLAWVAHQIVRDPIHLFDANIFYPARHTLAFSEHLFLQSMMVAPILWGGGSPVLAYNLALLLGFALTGWSAACALQIWTGSWPAAILGGSLFSFNAFTLTRLPHIQVQHLEFFPLMLIALDKFLTGPTPRRGLGLALSFSLQALGSMYMLVFSALVLVIGSLVRARDWVGSRRWTFVAAAILAGAASMVMLSPFLIPYAQARHEQEAAAPGTFVRHLEEVRENSAQISDYLATGGTFHNRLWSGHFFRNNGFFPGLTAAALALLAIVTGVAFRDRRAVIATAFGFVGAVLSLGPSAGLYVVAYRLFPPLAVIRDAARFGQLFLAAIAILAGFGFVVLQRSLPRKWGLAACICLLVSVHLEALRAPIDYSRAGLYGGVPPIFKTLDTPGEEVVGIFPFYRVESVFMNARYMLASTAFWKPMLNGYSGYTPASYVRAVDRLSQFPDTESIEYLERLNVTRVLVDARNMPGASLARLDQFSQLHMIATDGNLRIYQLDDATSRAQSR